MQRVFLLLLYFIYPAICLAQAQRTITKVTSSYTLKQTTSFYNLGNKNIGVVTYKYNNNPNILMINVHDDEVTAIETSKQVLRKTGGTLIKINNDTQRLVSFKLNNILYTFDPNRMFTQNGIITSLNKYECYSPDAVEKIEGFAKFVLSKIPADNATLIALHNNHDGGYSINTYEGKGDLSGDSGAINIDDIRATDDFFLTTDEIIYNKIRSYGYNVTLQNNLDANDDGSLSIYYGEKNKSYVNVETKHGKPEVQFNMLMIVINTPKRKIPDSYVYNYEIKDVGEKNIRNLKIFFGTKYIGTILSAYYAPAYKKIIGQLEIDNSFRVFSNTDFFLNSKKNTPEIEVRVDPTRINNSADPLKETIRIAIKE